MRKKGVKQPTSATRPVKRIALDGVAAAKAVSVQADRSLEKIAGHVGVADILRSVAIKQMEILDAMDSAGILFDSGGNVICCNRAFQQLPEDGIVLRDHRLIATDSKSDAELQNLLHRALAAETDLSSQGPPTIVLARQIHRPLLATVLVVNRQADSPHSNYAILLITDPDNRSRPDEAILRGAFGLTPSEVALAQCLAMGESLGSVAIRSRISRQTVARQLKAIFRKTKLHHRSELLRLLISLRNPLRRAD